MAKPYIKDPKGVAGGRFGPNGEDQEDFEQEKLIAEWLKSEGRSEQFGFEYINRKGTARNTIDQRSIRLDAQVRDEAGSRTYADIIAGSDGRDLECGGEIDETPPDPQQKIFCYIEALGFNKGEIIWVTRMLKLSIPQKQLRSEKYLTDLEWWKQFEPFNT